MPAFKLTKELFIKEKLSDEIMRLVYDMPQDGRLKSDLLQILNVENAKAQIEVLKKVTKELCNRVKHSADNEDVVLALRYLVHIFFISTSKNPSRRVLISHFQGLPENVRKKVIGPAITHALLDLCNRPIRTSETGTDEPIKFVDTIGLRHNVDTIAAVIENFPLGEDCVSQVCLECLTYLGQVQDNFFLSYGDWLSPVQQNEVMHHCLETIKLANRICQKSSVSLETKLNDRIQLETYRQVVHQFIGIDVRILQTDDFLLDCKTTSAMNIWLMLRFCLNRDQLITQASKTMFQHVSWLDVSRNKSDILPEWLQDLHFEQLTKSNLSNSAYLCSCYGFLAMVAMETLFLSIDGKCLLLDVLLQEFLDLSKSSSDVGSKLLAAKSVCFLTQKVRDYCCQGNTIPVEVADRLLGYSDDMKAVLQFVWTAWEDSVDAIRFTVKDVFENVVAIHVHLNSNTVLVKDDPLLHQLALSILNEVNWSCKGKYPTLSVLVSHLGSTRILKLHPGIAREILEQMQEQTLACYASGLYEKMFNSHKAELDQELSNQSEISIWFQQWLEPVLTVLCESNVLQKKHTIEYILPKLLKTGSTTLHYIIQRLSALSGDKSANQSTQNKPRTDTGGELGALIICLRRARALGLLKTNDNDNGVERTGELWCGVVDVILLKQALICNDDQIRLDAFALLCENQKTSEPISSTELQLITYFIPDNLNNQNPAFRQHFLSLLKKFLSRMKESSVALKRRVNKEKTAASNLNQYKVFLEQFTKTMFSQLYPGSVFARRTTSLGAISLLKETLGSQKNGGDEEYSFYKCIRQQDLNCLIFCLTDTFEDNKMEAASLLIACANNTSSPPLGDSVVRELLGISLSLSQSTRPQDSTTAAYLLSVLTHQHNMHTVLTQHIQSSQNENLKSDLETNVLIDDHEKKREDKGNMIERADVDKVVMTESADGEKVSTTEKEDFVKMPGQNEDDKKVLKNVKGGDNELVRRYMLLEILMKNLESQTETAKSSLIVAAANKPLYPTIQCMRYCFAEIKYRKIPSESVADWRDLVARFIALCFEISGVVSPVVCNSSPEGNVPVEAVTGIETLEGRDSENLSKSKETVMLMPEYLIVCCWRSVKEISLLLGQLTANLPIVGAGSDGGLLTYDQVIQVGEFFTTLLLESKHRGAFELAYTGFVKVTDMMWRSSDPDLHKLPRKWLNEVMVDIKSNDPESRLCATRRSAGVPFYVQALVTTEPSSTGRQCFRLTIQELLALAFDETIVTQDKCTAKVHALNILRAMYKDSRLRDDVAPFLADGLKVAILGFKSPLWAVRNSATLLMTAMMTRIFGVKRSKDETTFSRKNCQTGRTFFYNYPSLYQFLLEQIAMATEHVTSQLHPGLFPILMVLGRLFPSAMEGTDTSLNLAAFIPYVVKCSANPVLKTRVMAAKALQPLVEKDQVTSVFHDLLTLLPNQSSDIMRQNQIHGVLLQISQLCRTMPLLPDSIQNKLSSVITDMWTDRMNILMSRHNRCLATRTVAIDITHNFIQHFGDKARFVGILSGIVSEEINSLDTAYDSCTPALSEFQTMICKLYCKLYLDVSSIEDGSDSLHDRSFDTVKDETSMKYIGTDVIQKMSNEQNDGQKSISTDGTGDGSVAMQNIDKVKDMILTCPKSKSYEIRKTVLLQLKGMMPGSREECRVPVEFADSVCIIAEGSNQLLVEMVPSLLDILDVESHEECKIELLGLLEHCLGRFCISDRLVMTLMQSVQTLLNQIQAQTCSDKLTASVVTFSGTAISQLCKMLSIGRDSASRTISEAEIDLQDDRKKHLVSMATLVVMFVNIIKGYSEQMETCSEILLACAKALQQNGTHLLGSDSQNTDNIYKCVLDLLQADDIEVRETAATFVYSVSLQETKAYGQPYMAIKDLLDNIVLQGRLAGNNKHVVKLLFGMMLKDREDDQEYEERLFDRGEMNTYWDELDLIQMLDGAIMKCAYCDNYSQKPSEHVLTKPSVDIKQEFENGENLSQSDQWKNIRSAVEKYFQSGHVTLADGRKLVDDTELTFRNIFFNTSAYQKHVISLYRTLIMVKYGKLLSSNCDEDKCTLVEKTVVKLNSTTDRTVWLPVLYDRLLEL